MKLKLALLVPLLALGGCAANTYCEGQQDYQTARSVPAAQPAGALRIPESEGALRIPPPPDNAVPYGEAYLDEDGDEAVRCLDKPPEMPPPVEPKPLPEEQKPVEPAPADNKPG
jgi:hypothetical protein